MRGRQAGGKAARAGRRAAGRDPEQGTGRPRASATAGELQGGG